MDLDRALKDLKLPPELADKLAKETGAAFKDFKGKGGEDSTISYDELTESVGAFSKTISSAERAQEMANRALEFWQKNLNEYSDSMNQAAGYQVESNSRMRRASDIQIKSANELNKTLGKSTSMNSQIQITQDSFKARTTGRTSDPTAIGDSVRGLNNKRDQQQKSSDSLIREQGQGGIEEYKMMRTRLNATNVALKENYDALKDMAENTDIASAALSRISEIKDQRKSGENLIERLVTSDVEGIAKFNSSMLRLNNNMKGVANVGTTSEQRSQSLQDFNSIAPLLGNGKNNQS